MVNHFIRRLTGHSDGNLITGNSECSCQVSQEVEPVNGILPFADSNFVSHQFLLPKRVQIYTLNLILDKVSRNLFLMAWLCTTGRRYICCKRLIGFSAKFCHLFHYV